jgi:hypothetical protein
VAKFLTGFGCSAAAADKVEGESRILEDMICMYERIWLYVG